MTVPGVRKHLLTVALGDPPDLTSLLVTRLGVSIAVAHRWIERGAVEVDRARANARSALRTGARVVVRPPLVEEAEQPPPLTLLYRDEHLLVVDKPAGMLSQPSPGESATALEQRLRAIDERATLVHRIDRDTSGIVVAALEGPTIASLQRALADGAVERSYRALVEGRLDRPREIRLRIARDPHDVRRRVALPEDAPGGQAAATLALPLTPLADRSLVEAKLVTGRTHQIRVHLSAIGHAIVGDRLYGGAPAPRLMLHAHRLRLRHPVTGEALTIESPPPAELR